MNYTDKIHELVRQNLPPSAFPCEHLEGCILQLLQEAERDATDEVRKAHSDEVLAHIETKKELQVYKTLAAQSVNGGWPAALVQRCAELEAEVTGLKDNWSNERDMLKTAWDRESAVGRHLREEIGRLRDGWKASEVRLEKAEVERRTALRRSEEAEALRRNAFKEVRKELEAELMTASALCASCPKQAADEARDRAEKKLEASLRAQEKLEKKIAGFRGVLSPFKHLLEDL